MVTISLILNRNRILVIRAITAPIYPFSKKYLGIAISKSHLYVKRYKIQAQLKKIYFVFFFWIFLLPSNIILSFIFITYIP